MSTNRFLAGAPAFILSACLVLFAAGCGDGSPGATPDAGTPDGGNGDLASETPPDTGPDVVLGTPQKLVILHTNDIHSHLQGEGPEADYTPATTDDDTTKGGMARLATAIGTARAQAGTTPVMLLDAGDFMMGTLFEVLATKSPPELKFMKALGYDATTLGNHELDWTPRGLAGLLQAAILDGSNVPILASNMKFSDADADTGDDDLKTLVGLTGAIQPKLVGMFGTLKVGMFGLLGADAVQVTPQAAPLKFNPIVDAAKAMIQELRETDHVDLVIALSHSGISADKKGEDADLAAMAPGIDVIISGHTHDKLDQPAVVGNTLIVTAGSYGQYLGKLEITVTPGATPAVALDKYTLQPIDDKIPGDAATQTGVEKFIAGVNLALQMAGLPAALGLPEDAMLYAAPIAETGADLSLPTYSEAPVGNLVADAYRLVSAQLSAAKQLPPPVIGVEANGQIRAPILKGKTGQVWLADLFRVLPIGIGPDGKPGYPLVTFYLNAKDLRAGLELDAAGPPLSDQYFLQVSGLKATYDPTKNLFGRVTELKLVSGTTETALDLNDTTTCYKVVATNYVAGLLGLISTLTKGILSVQAKAADCTTLINPTDAQYYVDANPAMDGTQELKHWQALLKYVSSFPDTDATPNMIKNIPLPYTSAQQRIVKQ